MDNQDNNQESSMRPWIIYLVIFGAIFMLLMAGRNKTEDSTEITYDQFIGMITNKVEGDDILICLLYTSPSPRDGLLSRMPSSA